MRLLNVVLSFFVFAVVHLDASDLFPETKRIQWTDNYFASEPSLSPSGNCLAFYVYPKSAERFRYRDKVYLITSDFPEYRLAWESNGSSANYIQCLDDKLLVQTEDRTIYKVDLTTLAGAVYLSVGTQTNLGKITNIERFSVDDLPPYSAYALATIGGTEGLYRVFGNNVELVIPAIDFGFTRHFRTLHISGSHMLSQGVFEDGSFIVQTNLTTKFVEKLPIRRNKKTEKGRYYTTMPLVPWSSGNLLTVTTVTFPAPATGHRSHLLYSARGNLLPADFFAVNGPEEIASVLEDINSIVLSESANFGFTGATLHSQGHEWLVLEDGNVLLEKRGQTPDRQVIYSLGGSSSSVNGYVAIAHRENRDSTFSSGFYFVRTAPAPPPLEEDEPDPPVFSAETITNAASFVPGPIAPRTWTSIFGENLISEKYAWRLHVDNVEVPLGRISLETSSQINFLTPDVLGPEAEIAIVHFDADGFEDVRTEVTVTVAQHAPGLFQMVDENGEYQVIVTNNSPFFVVTKERPVAQTAPGAINLWGTGFNESTSVTATLEGQDTKVLWHGEPRDQYGNVVPGLTQINIELPPGLSGTVLGEARIGGTIFPLRFYVEEVK